jgi:hypothetical protein
LQTLKLPPPEELVKWPFERNTEVPFGVTNVDEDILQYFHDNSYRGADIENGFVKYYF